ncbi:MAG: hypothetical protein ABH864_06580 [archaeon]
MKGKTDSLAVFAGIILIVLGVVLIIVALVGFWPVAIHGIICSVIGIAILATLRQQEHIEPIKTERNKNEGGYGK